MEYARIFGDDISTKKHTKVLDIGCTLSMKNGVIWCNESQPLLVKYLKPFLGYIYENDDVYEDLQQSL